MQRILVIDDDNGFRSVVVRVLRNKGFSVFEATDGATGVKLARIHLPDLVISDVRMEGLDGYGVLEQLRHEAVTANTPFILTTGRADLEGMRQGMSLGADDYLAKPFSNDELVAAVNRRLQKQQAIREEADQRLAELRSKISMMLPHELLTPLNGILGIGQFMRMDAETMSPKEIAEYGDMIQECGEDLHRLVGNFLIYAQVEILATDPQKVRELRTAPAINLSEVLATQAKIKAAAVTRWPDLVLELMPATVAISQENLVKIVQELLDNAFKFSKSGTRVRVVTFADDHVVHWAISDAGRGMKPEFLANIGAYMQFERKVHEQRGSGLGLAIAKRLVEIHGGELAIESQIGQGTTVHVMLPKA